MSNRHFHKSISTHTTVDDGGSNFRGPGRRADGKSLTKHDEHNESRKDELGKLRIVGDAIKSNVSQTLEVEDLRFAGSAASCANKSLKEACNNAKVMESLSEADVSVIGNIEKSAVSVYCKAKSMSFED